MELNLTGVKDRQFYHAKSFFMPSLFSRHFCGERWLAGRPIWVTARPAGTPRSPR
jgi:hypothetical protein